VYGLRQPKKGTPTTPDFGVWVEGKQGSKGGTFLAHGSEGIMREIFGDIIEKIPMKLTDLLPLKLPVLCILSYSFVSLQLCLPI
jgi:hypothetical protein